MFNCQKDPLVELFKKKGYNLISVPKDKIEALQILTKSKEGFIGWLKETIDETKIAIGLSNTFQQTVDEAGVTLDFILADNTDTKYKPRKSKRSISNFRDATSNSLSLNARVELFCNLCAINNKLTDDQKVALKTAFSTAEQFSFKVAGEPQEHYISVEQLKSHIARATLSEDFERNRFKDTSYYIVTSVLLCNSFEMKASNNKGEDINLDVEALHEIAKIDANIALNFINNNSSTVSVEHSKPLAVAFKAVRLFYDKKTGKLSIRNKLGLTMRGKDDIQNSPYEYLISEQNFISL